VFLQDFSGCAATERRPAGEHCVEHSAKRIQIAAGSRALAARLFRRHVFGCSHDAACLGQSCGCEQTGHTEVSQLQRAIAGEHQIAGFEIPVDDTCCMGGFESHGGLQCQFQHFAPRQSSPGMDFSRERRAVHIFHGVVQTAICRDSILIEGDYVAAGELSQHLNLTAEPLCKAFFPRDRRGQNLHRGLNAGD